MSKRIEVNDLNVYYGKFKAVEDVTLTIEPRTVTAFIGPSGCGKSTFLRTLNRMHEVIPGARVEGEGRVGDGIDGELGVDEVAAQRGGRPADGRGLDVGDVHDMRAADLRRDARLLKEPLDQAGATREVAVQHLDRDVAIMLEIGREIDRRHPPAPSSRSTR